MSVSYKNLWKLLIDKGMSKSDLKQASGISSVTLAKLSKSEPVGASTLMKLCAALNCHIPDIIDCSAENQNQDEVSQ